MLTGIQREGFLANYAKSIIMIPALYMVCGWPPGLANSILLFCIRK